VAYLDAIAAEKGTAAPSAEASLVLGIHWQSSSLSAPH
jgi:hypothetical protein